MAKNDASKRSKIPPCPGIILPESFTPKLRLNNDSSKSPKIAAGTINSADTNQNNWCEGSNSMLIPHAINPVKIAPPIVPSQVFLGEIRSNNLRFPKNLPDKNAKVSLVQISKNIPANTGKSKFAFKWMSIAKSKGAQTYINPKMEMPMFSNGFTFFRQSSVLHQVKYKQSANGTPQGA